jgi:pimeloyl-ACP methyl ester carboxylesterase
MINALPNYHDTWRKWAETRLQTGLVRMLGLKRTAHVVGRRLFPYPHQEAMRERVKSVLGSNPRVPYLETVRALVGWNALDRLESLRCPTLMIAAEHDYTPLEEKRRIAARLGAEFAMIQGSRHGTPFDAVEACNACLLAFLRGEALPEESQLRIDPPEIAQQLVAQAAAVFGGVEL